MNLFSSRTPASEILMHIAVSFGPNSGGRTNATFARSALLARQFPNQLVITLNHRMEYKTIFEDWAHRHKLPRSIRMRNMFEDIAGEELYLPKGNAEVFDVTAVAKATQNPLCWVSSYGSKKKIYSLRKDGSLAHVKHFIDGNWVKLDRYDRSSVLRTREMRNNNEVLQISYFLANGNRFANVTPTLNTLDAKITIDSGQFATDGRAIPVSDLQKRWMAGLCEEIRRPIALIDDRSADKLFIDNQFLRKKIPTIAIIHSSHLRAPYTDVTAINSFNGPTIARSDEFSAVSFLSEQQLTDVRQVHDCLNGWVIPNVVGNQPWPRLKWRSSQKFVLVTRLVELKRLDHAVRAFSQVLQRFPNAKLEIWGTGDHEAALKNLIRELGLGKSVKLKGYTKMPGQAYQGAAGSLVVSKYEGFGFALVEPLAQGIPVIAYNFRYGPQAMLMNGFNGYIVENGNIDALANGIAKILASPVRSRMMGLLALSIRFRFSERRVRRKWEKIIKFSIAEK